MSSQIKAFLNVLDSRDNSTGGGTASAVAGAMAAGLAAMVARLSLGKKDLASNEHYEGIAEHCENLCRTLFNGGYEDSNAFAQVSMAYRMSKQTDAEKVARNLAIQRAMVYAAEVPLKNAERCQDVLTQCRVLNSKFNTNAASDLECAKYLARAGLSGCAANVRINLPYIKDESICRNLEKGLAELEGK